jgi:hypothetical protein
VFVTDISILVAGSFTRLGWTGATGPVTLLLKKGDPNDLITVGTIVTGEGDRT